MERHRTGRIIATVVFSTLCVYFGTAILGSIANDLYGGPPQGAVRLDAAEHAWCVRNLVGLNDELETRMLHEVRARAVEDRPSMLWNEWNREFVTRLDGAQARCTADADPMPQAFENLRRLYQGYGQSLDDLGHLREEVAASLVDAIKSLRARSTN